MAVKMAFFRDSLGLGKSAGYSKIRKRFKFDELLFVN